MSANNIFERQLAVDMDDDVFQQLKGCGVMEFPEPSFSDHANCKSNSKIMLQIGTEKGERILFSCIVAKKNKFGMNQDRVLLLTNQYLYNIKDMSTV